MAGNVGVCPLCRTEQRIRDSHIIPEFFYRRLYDDQGTARSLSSDKLGVEKLQKGLRDELLCDSCEQRMNRFESRFAKDWYERDLMPKVVDEDHCIVEGLDYVSTKLLFLSILWRASVSMSDACDGVSLGPHEDRIRDLLLEENLGRDDYRIWGRVIAYSPSNKVAHHLVTTPARVRFRGLNAYQMVFGGVAWLVVLSTGQTLPIDPLCFRQSGRLHLVRTRPEGVMSLRHFIEREDAETISSPD